MKAFFATLALALACGSGQALAQCPPQSWGQPGFSISVGNGGWGQPGLQWGISVGNQLPAVPVQGYPGVYPVQVPMIPASYPVYTNPYPVYQAYPACPPAQVYRRPGRHRGCR